MRTSDNTSPKTCPQAERMLEALGADDQATLDAHLPGCPQCTQLIRFERSLGGALRADTRRPRASADVVWYRAGRERTVRRRSHALMAAAAVVLVAFGMALAMTLQRVAWQTAQPVAPVAEGFHLDGDTREAAIAGGVAYLQQTQMSDGGWAASAGDRLSDLDVTTVATISLLRAGVAVDDPSVSRALDFIAARAQRDAAATDSRVHSYQTAVALLLVLRAGDAGQFDRIVSRAQAYLEEARRTAG